MRAISFGTIPFIVVFSVLFCVEIRLVIMLLHRLFDFARCSTIWIQLLRFFSTNWLRQIRVCLFFITHIRFDMNPTFYRRKYNMNRTHKAYRKTQSFRYATGNIFFHSSTLTISHSFGTNDELKHILCEREIAKKADSFSGKSGEWNKQQQQQHENANALSNMRRQIIWGHKACIQQYLQRVMNITATAICWYSCYFNLLYYIDAACYAFRYCFVALPTANCHSSS